ncbi:winged helix-turn-helix domain-containing protein [Microlunatus endophyticus]|uniref:winged helix-turn-helix domain-containing protein n=1 Tax=Microlunatus endophyticus TaxID=1716077 RepID=UPI00166DB14C|nr:winged helix-turn-helix domain-containing protein [Microlunatus endophyticus]
MTQGDDPNITPELSVDALLKLANVVRFRIYVALRAFGTLRARQLAELTGVTETSMNRHLDVMREVGFVQVSQTGKTRQSWLWSAVPGGVRVGRIEGGEIQEAALEWLRAVSGGYGIIASQWPSVAASWPQTWQSAAETSDWVMHLTAQQLDELAADLRAVAMKWKRASEANETAWSDQQAEPGDPDWIAPVVVILTAIPYPRRPQ